MVLKQIQWDLNPARIVGRNYSLPSSIFPLWSVTNVYILWSNEHREIMFRLRHSAGYLCVCRLNVELKVNWHGRCSLWRPKGYGLKLNLIFVFMMSVLEIGSLSINPSSSRNTEMS